jgi:hypothetical protein
MTLRTATLACFAFTLLITLTVENATAQFGIFKSKKDEPKRTNTSIYDMETLIEPMIPTQRQVFHNKIDKEQRKADVSDGSVDNMIYYSEDTALTNSLTRSMLTDVDRMQILVENLEISKDPSVENNVKIRYLSALFNMMQRYNRDVSIKPAHYRKLVTNMRELIIAAHENRLEQFAKSNATIYTLENSDKIMEERPDLRSYVYGAVGRQYPEMMIKRLNEYATESFACEIIAAAARILPNEIYTYASSTNVKIRGAVRDCKDPLVQSIVQITDKSRSPLKALSFLGDIYNNKMTIAQADSITANPDVYYQNLVRLRIEGDTLGRSTYTNELAYNGLRYVREMNDLHEEPDVKRFKCIEKMAPQTLYYLMIFGQDEIYTSSFIGTFNRMMERIKPSTTDSFLLSVNHDRFRTFIRMCAGYNTLSTFLNAMPQEKKTELMSNFIAGLDKGASDDLEDAVDVADAYGSIKDSSLAMFLRNRVKDNYEMAYKSRSRKGMVLYGLMAAIFDGSKALSSQDEVIKQSEVLNLPPVNLVPYASLINDSGIIYEQFYFYGDEDGKSSYNSFLGNFKDGKWRIVTDKYWTTITSTQGKPIVVYANNPIPEPGDEEAQEKLNTYLNEQDIHPTFVVHRGHSYHLPLTMENLSKENKIVMLGSCGGYHNLAVVLNHAPDAHIISSKQTGMMVINEPIIKAINNQLLAGNDVNWISIWNQIDPTMKPPIREKWLDYVPPYKNLGVIFIKSYRKLTVDLAAIR